MRKIVVFAVFCLFSCGLLHAGPRLKVLHVTFHDGCIDEIKAAAEVSDLELTSWNVHKLYPYAFDPKTMNGNKLYNIDHDRAWRIWNHNKAFFDQFDAVIVSDTVPLSRIFLQNGWSKPLIIWITQRFDFNSPVEKKPTFPDKEFYDLMKRAKTQENVFIAASNAYEYFYAREKGVDLGDRVIKACAGYLSNWEGDRAFDPQRNDQVFIHIRTESVQMATKSQFSVSKKVKELGIPAACYRYNDLKELTAHKGVLYLPYQWCVLTFFETLRLGMPTFVPSEAFLFQLMNEMPYHFDQIEYLKRDRLFHLAEWYQPEFKDIVIYFDSWEDLRNKVLSLDYESVHAKTLEYGIEHTKEMLSRWQELFEEVRAFSENQNLSILR